jgi:TetR/AcrR family transcriptional repressor of nem operon
MGRPREFDERDALVAAMQVFWLKGYVATSMADLMKAMELHKGSIYKAFGGKHQLFVSALKHYLKEEASGMRHAFESAETPKDAIRAFLRTTLSECVTGPVCRGCLMMNSVVELAPHDEAVRSIIEGFMKRIRVELTKWISRGQETGQFRSDRKPDELAEYLMFVKAGILSASKVKLEAQDPFRAAELALSAIE